MKWNEMKTKKKNVEKLTRLIRNETQLIKKWLKVDEKLRNFALDNTNQEIR